VRKLVEKRVREVVAGVAQMTGAKIDLSYEPGYPVVVNHARQTDFAIQVAKEVAGDVNVQEMPPLMGGEDFAYMLEQRPGAFIFCGNGDSAGLQSSRLQFRRRRDRLWHVVLDQAGREHAGRVNRFI